VAIAATAAPVGRGEHRRLERAAALRRCDPGTGSATSSPRQRIPQRAGVLDDGLGVVGVRVCTQRHDLRPRSTRARASAAPRNARKSASSSRKRAELGVVVELDVR